VHPLPFHFLTIFADTEAFQPHILCHVLNPKVPKFGVGERLAAGLGAMQAQAECL